MNAPRAAAAAAPFVDAAGVAHAPVRGGARIVSLVPSITELLCDLGLTGALVGRTGYCVHPAAAVEAIPQVGGTKKVDLAKVRALKPTHVIVNVDENLRETAAALAGFVPSVVVTHPLGPEDNPSLYRLLGGIFDCADAAETLVARFESTLERVRRESQGFGTREVVYLIWRKPWMTVSPDTYISRMLAVVGLRTLPRDCAQRYPEIALPRDAAGADCVLLSSEPFPFGDRHVAEIGALGAGRLCPRIIDGEMVSWYGSRAIRGLDYLLNCAATLAAERAA